MTHDDDKKTESVTTEEEVNQPGSPEQEGEQPVILMDDDIPIQQEIELDNLHLDEDDLDAQDGEVVLPPNAIEPVDHPDMQADEYAPRRSARVPKFSARFNEFRKSLGLIGLIGN